MKARRSGHRTTFPGFGQELYAPAEGRVAAVRDTARDHRSRSTTLAYAYLMVQGSLRQLVGSRHVLGNYMIIAQGDGCTPVLAHLRRGPRGSGVASGWHAGMRWPAGGIPATPASRTCTSS